MCAPSGSQQPTNTTVTQKTELPAWYSDYLQQVMGRAVTQAGDQTPPPTQQIAGMTPDQLAAYQTVRDTQGAYQPAFDQASSLYTSGADTPFLGRAWSGSTDWRNAEQGLTDTANTNTAASADPYMQQGAQFLQQSGLGSAAASANPYINAAVSQNSLGAASPYLNAAVSQSGLGAASPYLNAASQSFPQAADAYMSPYTSAVTDRLATLAGRNLQENILPSVNDQFIKAGQYGSTQNRDITSRALRDTQESLLGQQAQALEQGYGQAGQLFNADASRAAQLAGTAGGLGSAQQQALLQAGATTGGLSGAQQQALLQAGSTTGGLSAADLSRMQSSGATLGQLGLGYAGANAADQARALAAYQGLGSIGTQIGQLGLGASQAQSNAQLGAAQGLQGLGTASQQNALQGAAAQEAAGAAQQGQSQANLNAMYQQMAAQYNLPWQNIANLSSVIQGLPVNQSVSGQTQTTTPGASPLSQVAGVGLGIAGLSNSGLFKAKGGAVRKPKSRASHSYGSLPRKGLGFAAEAA